MRSAGRGTGAASKLIDTFFRTENILAPVTGDWDRAPGPRTLEIPNLAPEDVERMDFVAA